MGKIKKKLGTAIGAALFIFLNNKFQLGIDDQTVKYIVLIVIAYIGGQGLADIGKEKEKIKSIQETKVVD